MNLEKEFMDKLDQIRFWGKSGSVHNPTNFKMVGKGVQGAVFQIDAERCVKIYHRQTQDLEQELKNLQLGNSIGICPKVFLSGDNFIVMEYFSSPSLLNYLKENPLTKELTAKIIELLEAFESIGFNRLDHALRHIYLAPDGKLKIIDVVNSTKKQVPLPEKIMKDMGAKAHEFLQFVQEISPKWYQRWTNHPDFPEFIKSVTL